MSRYGGKAEAAISRPRTHCTTWLLVSIVALAVALRFFQLGEWSFWHDEALSVLLARKPLTDLLHIAAGDVHPPLYFLVVRAFLVLGQSEAIVRLPSALCSSAVVLGLYLVAHDLFDSRVALVSAFLFTVCPFQLFYAQEARMYAQLELFTVLCCWCFIRALRGNRLEWWGGFVICGALASYTAYFVVFVFLAQAFYVFLVDRRCDRIWRFLLSGVAIGVLYSPWMWVSLNQTRAVLASYWMERPNPLVLVTTLSTFLLSYSLQPILAVPGMAAALFLLMVVLNSLRYAMRDPRSPRRAFVWLLLWTFVPLLATYLVSLIRPIFHVRTVIVAAPALYVLLAWGITRAPRWKTNLALAIPTGLLMLVSAWNFYFTPAFAKLPMREVAAYVRERTQPGDIVLHTSSGSYLPCLCYPTAGRHVLLPEAESAARKNAPSQAIVVEVGSGPPLPLNEAVRDAQRAWLVVALDHAIEHQLSLKEEMDERYTLLDATDIRNIGIMLYDLTPCTEE